MARPMIPQGWFPQLVSRADLEEARTAKRRREARVTKECFNCGAQLPRDDRPCLRCKTCRVCGWQAAVCKGRCEPCYHYWVRHSRAADRPLELILEHAENWVAPGSH